MATLLQCSHKHKIPNELIHKHPAATIEVRILPSTSYSPVGCDVPKSKAMGPFSLKTDFRFEHFGLKLGVKSQMKHFDSHLYP